MGRVAFAFMAAALFFLGSMQPVFASSVPYSYVNALTDDSLNFAISTSLSRQPVLSLAGINKSGFMEQGSNPSSASSLYSAVTYDVAVRCFVSITGLVAGQVYNGQVRFSLGDSFTATSGSNWSAPQSILYDVITTFPDNAGIEIRNSTSNGVSDIIVNFHDYLAQNHLVNLTCHCVFKVSMFCISEPYMKTAYSLVNTWSSILTYNGVNANFSPQNVSILRRNNASNVNVFNNLQTGLNTVNTNLGTTNTWLDTINTNTVTGNTLINQFKIENANNIANQTLSINSVLNNGFNKVHNDLVTIHNDLTDPDQSQDDAKDNYESVAGEKEDIESSFAAFADSDTIIQDYDVILDDDRMNIGELAEGSIFWYELTERFFNSAENVNAEYPFLLQVFLNMLGRLW